MPLNRIPLFFVIVLLASCASYNKTYIDPEIKVDLKAALPEGEIIETLYLVGDAGSEEHYDDKQKYLYAHLRKQLEAKGEKGAIVYLGDNIYPRGLPKKEDPERGPAENALNNQLEVVRDLPSKTYFIPGNHDWNRMSEGGLKAVKRQEKYVQNYFEDQKVHFYPNGGCGDPVVKKITKDLYYVFVDTQWWLQDWNKEKNINKGCSVKSRQEFLQQLEAIFLEHKNDQIVVLMHHPFFSRGEHGGHYSLKRHIFPLTVIKENLYLPLPGLGSLMPLYRALGGVRQDIPHPLYQELRNGVLDMIKRNKQNKNIVFACGHDHNLQYYAVDGQHFVLSGAGSKINFVQQGGGAKMLRSALGYSVLHFYEDGRVWLDFLKVDAETPTGELIYREQIVKAREGTLPIKIDYPIGNALLDSMTMAANKNFASKKTKEAFLGKQYRDIWATPVTVPILNLETEKGGLTPVKKGGGMASNSLRLENPDGAHYALRSIRKDYTKLFGPEMENLRAIGIIEDLNSSSHPYAALTLPKLSEAANIYYTIPQLVYLQRQEALGFYNDLLSEELYLLEDLPDGNREDAPNLGNPDEIISYLDLLDLKRENNKVQVDEPWALRSRLFDIWIHDWDRHDDQWRWARIEENGETLYRPIPRDRDQAFYKFDGFVPKTVAYFGVKKFKNFGEDLKDVKWQSFNARYFDRYFLHEMEWPDWEREIKFLQEELSDEVVLEAASQIPAEISTFHTKELTKKLIARRDRLNIYAKKLYDYLSLVVSIPGSNERELFEVQRLKKGDVRVRMYDLSKKGKKKDKRYERTFKKNETKEIRLYGLGGKDVFKLGGRARKSILVRVIGGFGQDEVVDSSKIAGPRKLTKIYDQPDGIEISSEGESRNNSSNRLNVNEYDRKDHLYDKGLYYPILGYTGDDGLWLGATLTVTRFGFRKSPYRNKQLFELSISPTSRNAFHMKYRGDFIRVLFNYFDLVLGTRLDNPIYANYFGLGNNTLQTATDDDYNRIRMRQNEAFVYLKRSWVANRFSIYAGPYFNNNSSSEKDGIANDPNSEITAEELDWKNYLGGRAGFRVNTVDNKRFPKEGMLLDINGTLLADIGNGDRTTLLNINQTFYLTFGTKFPLTLASRTGWSLAKGKLPFYQYPSLGYNNYLRGFRNDRFRGQQVFYQNTDLRMQLVNWKNNILPMKIGLVGGHDFGRVWQDGFSLGKMHQGFTAGLWFDILSYIVIQPHISFSKEGTQINFRLGFNF